jgi:hypothetical protein
MAAPADGVARPRERRDWPGTAARAMHRAGVRGVCYEGMGDCTPRLSLVKRARHPRHAAVRQPPRQRVGRRGSWPLRFAQGAAASPPDSSGVANTTPPAPAVGITADVPNAPFPNCPEGRSLSRTPRRRRERRSSRTRRAPAWRRSASRIPSPRGLPHPHRADPDGVQMSLAPRHRDDEPAPRATVMLALS